MKKVRTKKPFNQTTIGKLLTSSVGKNLIKAIPFGIGSIAGGILEDNTTAPGKIEKKELLPQLLKLSFYAVLVYLMLKGTISMQEAEDARSLMD